MDAATWEALRMMKRIEELEVENAKLRKDHHDLLEIVSDCLDCSMMWDKREGLTEEQIEEALKEGWKESEAMGKFPKGQTPVDPSLRFKE